MAEAFGDLPITMSNYSIYFLAANPNAIQFNCSVYSLPLGRLSYVGYNTNHSYPNISDFLPAYYITNCSITDLAHSIAEQNIDPLDVSAWMHRYHENPYNVADNGDSFVALLYLVSGSCVSSWMLVLLLMLSPRHKRKPVITSSAILAFALYLTVLLVELTKEVENSYYADQLDMVKLWDVVARHDFSASALVINFLIHIAYLQLVWSFCNHHWRTLTTALVAVVSCVSLVTGAVAVATGVDVDDFTSVTERWRIAHVALNALFVLCVAVCLAYYTFCGTGASPREVSYCRKLLPLSVLVWFTIVLYIVISLLRVTLWRTNWLVHLWVAFIPPLLDVFILITAWEWHHSIKHLKSRLELGNMLGRRISMDDVLDFNTDSGPKRPKAKRRFSVLNPFRKLSSQHDVELVVSHTPSPSGSVELTNWNAHVISEDASVQEVQYDDSDFWDTDNDDDQNQNEPQNQGSNENQVLTHNENTQHASGSRTNDAEATTDATIPPADSSAPAHSSAGTGPQEGSSSAQDELPPFTPHPGYNREDYWDEK